MFRSPIIHFAFFALLFVLASVSSLQAHGINGHIHVTAWAIDELDDPELVELFSNPMVLNAAHFGASFPDSGYAVGNHYGELAHWEPFIEAFIQKVKGDHPPPFSSEETRMKVAFVMGMAAHGLQDALFDTLFLEQIATYDGGTQDDADRGTDAFLFTDGHLEHRPEVWAPVDDLVETYQNSLGHEVDAATIETGMMRVKLVVIDAFDALAPGFDDMYRPLVPWAAQHYLDQGIPGSLASEVPATAAYIRAIWERLHDRFPVSATVIYRYPEPPMRLRDRTANHVDSWITLVFGAGAVLGSLNPDTVTLTDQDGALVEIEVDHTRWLGNADNITRLLVLKPMVELAPNTEYTVTLYPGVELVDGQILQENWTYTLQTQCDPPESEACDPPTVPSPTSATGGCTVHRGSPLPLWFLVLSGGVYWGTRRRKKTDS